MSNDELLHKWINGNISEDELVVFRQRPEFTELTKIYQLTETISVPDIDKSVMLQTILSNTDKAKRKPQGRIISMSSFFKYAVAACLLIITGLFLFRSPDSRTIVAQNGEKLVQFLPDQSKVTLNSGSQLHYLETDWSDNRTLHLSGEAFFEVNKGSQFIVNTDFGLVKVLGTSFNVMARGAALEVACRTGKVAVLRLNGTEIVALSPTEAIRIEEGTIIKRWESPAVDIGRWTEGLSKFKNVPLAKVLAELERQFDVSIEAGNIDTRVQVSCNFQHENLDVALKTALGQLPIKYEIKANKVILSQ